jgi:hypothetical protein
MASAGFAIEIERAELDQLVGAATNLGDAVSSDDLKAAIGTGAREKIHDHLIEVAADTQHHQSAESLGANRTGFYERAADTMPTPQVTSEGVVISITEQGFAQRYFGGDITGNPLLTIPARAEAYGHRAREFDLKLIKFPSGIFALIDPAEDPHEGDVWYWLVHEVHQVGDPTILPTDDEIYGAALKAHTDYLQLVWDQQQAA